MNDKLLDMFREDRPDCGNHYNGKLTSCNQPNMRKLKQANERESCAYPFRILLGAVAAAMLREIKSSETHICSLYTRPAEQLVLERKPD